MIKIRNKNAILELLNDDGVKFKKIVVLKNLEQDELTQKIIQKATEKNIEIDYQQYRKMSKRRSGVTREVIFGVLASQETIQLKTHLANLEEKNEEPFFLVIDKVDFSNNVAFIARTAFAAGVNGIIFQKNIDNFFNEDTIQFSLGTIARIPLIKMNTFEAIKQLQKYAVKIIALDIKGTDYSRADLTGPTAFILGAEKDGLSDNLADRCDLKISIPIKKGIDSLNVGASTAIVLFEKVRQENLDSISN